MYKKIVWYDSRSLKDEKSTLSLVYNLRFQYVLVNADMYQRLKAPRKIKFIVDIDNIDNNTDLKKFPKDVVILSRQTELLQKVRKNGYSTALYRRIEKQEDLELPWKEVKHTNFLVIELTSETNIPLELLIAKLQNSETVLLKLVRSLQDAETTLGVMESGSDGVVLKSEKIQEIMEVDRFMLKEELGKLELVKAAVLDIQHIGMGYRACVDSTTIMRKNEGMLVGSTANGGLLISSETHYLPYMELRPFRVNAGAVHSYIWTPGDMTAYISELKGGKKVLCVDTAGNTREITIGRSKIEIRPLLKIEAEYEGIRVNAMVQDDWHIRLFGGDGEPCNASSIQIGDQLLAYISKGARHVGIKIDEMLLEK